MVGAKVLIAQGQDVSITARCGMGQGLSISSVVYCTSHHGLLLPSIEAA